MKGNIRTWCVRLEADDKDNLVKLHKTLVIHDLAFDLVSRHIFDHIGERNILAHKVIHAKTYRKCMKIPGMKSQIACKARQAAVSAYRTIRETGGSDWKTSIVEPPSKHNPSIRLDKRIFRLLPDNRLKISLVGRKMEVFRFRPYGKLSDFLSKCTMLDPLVFERKGELWLAVSFEMPCPTHIPSKCIGIDLGVKRLAVTSDGRIINLPTLAKAKRRVRYLKSVLQSLKRRQGRRRNQSARRKLRATRRREHNISKEMCHMVANQLLTTVASTLVLEDLTGLKGKNNGRRNNSRRAQVPLYETRRILTYKARALGKRVETVDPRFTSQDDYRGLPRGVRKGCRYYASDGKILDADHNAAINIAQRWTVQNKLPVSFAVPLDGTQTLWAGPGQRAECGSPCATSPTSALGG
jgi:IS605 OrfB family transposase